MTLNEKIIKEVAQKECNQFEIKHWNGYYQVELSENFQKCFFDEVNVYNDFFIFEIKKISDNLSIYKIKNSVVIKENKQNINEGLFDDVKGQLSKLFSKINVTDRNKDTIKLINNISKENNQKYKMKQAPDGQSIIVTDIGGGYITTITPDGSLSGGNRFSNFAKEELQNHYDAIKDMFKYTAFSDTNVYKMREDDNGFSITTKTQLKERSKKKSFWEENDISEIINEIVDPNSIDVEDFKKKDELSPNIWDDASGVIHEDARKGLLRIAKEFIEFAGLDKYKFQDITLTGSLANYNYSDVSDLDVHVLMDTTQISDDKELVEDYLKNKKSLWNDNMPIKVKGFDVELYVQDINEPHTSTGVYSLMKNKWLTKPIKEIIQLDTKNIQLKASEIMDRIDDIMDSEHTESTIAKIERLFDKIKAMRQAGLDDEGEFSVENIVFKILRRNGYIEKLLDLKRDLITKKLTVEYHA